MPSNAIELCSLSNRTDKIAYFVAMGDDCYINYDDHHRMKVSDDQIVLSAKKTFAIESTSTIFFEAHQN
jgi:hypothetical protein